MVTESGVAAPHASSHESGGSDVVDVGSAGTGPTVIKSMSAAAVSWTDLDLSSILGSRRRNVLLLMRHPVSATTNNIRVREKGINYEQITGGEGSASQIQIGDNMNGYVVCTTDSNGIFQYIAAAAHNLEISLMSWW